MRWTARLVLLLAALAALAAPASAQTSGRVYRLGVLSQSGSTLFRPVVLPELAKQGFVEGINLVVDHRIGFGEALPGLARELVDGAPDAIFAVATPALRVVRQATSTVPIILYGGQDAVTEGFAETLARPGGNITGVVIMGIDLDAKRLDLLREAVPAARRIGVLLHRGSPLREAGERKLRETAAAAWLGLLVETAGGREDYPAAFAAMRAGGAQALLISAQARFFADTAELTALALEARLPTACEWREMAEQGCLLGYGPDRTALYRRAAVYLVRVLQGASPAEMPIEQPTEFEFAVNLRTARALGIELPPSILARADEVIE